MTITKKKGVPNKIQGSTTGLTERLITLKENEYLKVSKATFKEARSIRSAVWSVRRTYGIHFNTHLRNNGHGAFSGYIRLAVKQKKRAKTGRKK